MLCRAEHGLDRAHFAEPRQRSAAVSLIVPNLGRASARSKLLLFLCCLADAFPRAVNLNLTSTDAATASQAASLATWHHEGSPAAGAWPTALVHLAQKPCRVPQRPNQRATAAARGVQDVAVGERQGGAMPPVRHAYLHRSSPVQTCRNPGPGGAARI